MHEYQHFDIGELDSVLSGLGEIRSIDEVTTYRGSMTVEERLETVDQAILVISQLYVHLPMKRPRHAIDPVASLKLLRSEAKDLSDAMFQIRLLEVLDSLRDVHLAYTPPEPWAAMVAFLPFLLKRVGSGENRAFIVSGLVAAFKHKTFDAGVEVTSWNGVPIGRAIELLAQSEGGNNRYAREALAIQYLTVRWLGASRLPDEHWVAVGYRDETGRSYEIRIPWRVMLLTRDPGFHFGSEAVWQLAQIAEQAKQETSGPGALLQAPELSRGLSLRSQVETRTRHRLFTDGAAEKAAEDRKRMSDGGPPDGPAVSEHRRVAAQGAKRHATRRTPHELRKAMTAPAPAPAPTPAPAVSPAPASNAPGDARPEAPASRPAAPPSTPQVPHQTVPTGAPVFEPPVPFKSYLPLLFEAETLLLDGFQCGYLRIRSFAYGAPSFFVDEVRRILRGLPQTGLIIDVRGNPGGTIQCAELMLQLVSPRRIQPLNFQFLGTELAKKLTQGPAGADGGVPRDNAWGRAVDFSLETGAVYSGGRPLTDPDKANAYGQIYYGPCALIIDATSFSSAEMFAAGFQDHGIGPILGVDPSTGGAGANCWTYDQFERQAEVTEAMPVKKLAGGAHIRFSVRRCMRVGPSEGAPLEEFGVEAEHLHAPTLTDILESGKDLKSRAIGLIRNRPTAKLRVEAQISGGLLKLSVTPVGANRVDVYIDNRPIASLDTDGKVPLGIISQLPFQMAETGYKLRVEAWRDGLEVANYCETLKAA